MPLRRSRVYALDVIAYTGRCRPARPARQLGNLRAGDRGGARRPLHHVAAARGRPVQRRTDADEGAADSRAERRRWEPREHRTASGELERSRARSRSGRSTACTAATGGDRGGASHRPAGPRSSRSIRIRASCSATSSSRSRRSSGGSSCSPSSASPRRRRRRLHARDGEAEPEEFAATYQLAIGAEVVVAGEEFRFGAKRRGDLELLERLGYEVLPVPLLEGVSSTAIRRQLHAGEVAEAARLLGRPPELDGTVVARRPAWRHARLSDREPRASSRGCSCLRTGSTPARPSATVPRSRSAPIRTTAATSAGSSRTCSTSRAISTASGSSSSCGNGCATSRCSRASRSSIDQIARDVEATREGRPTGLGRLRAVSANGPMIHARGLVKRFGDFVAVDGIDFDVQPGEAFGFLGPNGAGKSSTMRMIGCVSPVTGGDAAHPRPRSRRATARRSGPGSASSRRRTRSTSS